MDWETSTTFNDFLYEEGATVLADKIFSFVKTFDFDLEKFAKDNSIGVNSMKLDDLKAQIKNIPPNDLAALGVIVPARTKANGNFTYICPNCGNGEGDSGDGIAFEYKDGAWLAKCFKCGEGYDNLKLLALHYGLNVQTDFKEICNRAAADFGISTDSAAPPKYTPKVEETAFDDKELELIQADIASAAKNIEFLPLDARRGLSIDTLKKFNCGFIKDWKSPKSRVAGTFSTPTPRLIVPSGNHYLARLTVPVETFPADVQKYIRPKQHAGKKALFGSDTISNKTEFVYVFEGEIDAMSAWQAYESDFNIASICAFVATCGAAEQKWLAEVDNICKGFNIKPRFKIFFDNDDAGRDWAIKHRAELLKRGYLAISKTFADYGTEKIDANNILQEHGEEMLVNKLFYADDSDLFAAAKIEIDELERKLLAEKTAADKAAKEKDILQKMFTLPFSDMYNADRINLLFGDIIRYSEDSGEWMFFKNGAWTFGNDSVAALYPFARETAEFIDKNRPKFHYKKNSSGGLTLDNSKQQPADSDSVKFGETLARMWQKRKTQRAAIDLLKGVEDILITHNDLDKNPYLLNVKNGVINLEDGKLYPAAPELLLSKQANVIFNPAVRAPVFEKFMQDILPDEMTRRAVLRYLGYCLTGRVNSEKSLFVKGKGGNGKGTLFNTVLKMFGGYGTAFNINALLKPKYPKDGEAATPEFAKLEGARFVVVDEMPRGALFDVAKFKSVTGSDPIPIRPLFQPARVIENPTHKFVFSGNNIPDVESADDDGFNRRFSIAVFPMQFKGDNADITLKSRLVAADELSGILNILLAECQAWQAEGLIESEEMQTQKQKYLVENDFIRAFIFEECEVGEGYAVARKALLAALRRYDARAHMYKDFQLAEMVQNIDGVQCVKSGKHSEFKGAWIFTGLKIAGNDTVDVPFD